MIGGPNWLKGFGLSSGREDVLAFLGRDDPVLRAVDDELQGLETREAMGDDDASGDPIGVVENAHELGTRGTVKAHHFG